MLLVVTALIGPAAPRAPVVESAPARPVIVVMSTDAEPYQQALAGLRRELLAAAPGTTLDVVALHGDTARISLAVEAIRRGAPALIVTLGTAASEGILGRVDSVPVVAGMILNPAALKGAPNATGVYLEYPVEVELQWLQHILPGGRRLGVIYHSPESGRRVAEARRVAAADGNRVTLQAIRIDGPAQLPDALLDLTNRADVLWSLVDPVVYNAETARSLLLFTLRNRIALVGQSTAWVRAGALYALDRDYDDIGAQCAGLALRILAGEAPATLRPVAPRKVRYVVNRRTAADLRLTLPPRVWREAAEVVN